MADHFKLLRTYATTSLYKINIKFILANVTCTHFFLSLFSSIYHCRIICNTVVSVSLIKVEYHINMCEERINDILLFII